MNDVIRRVLGFTFLALEILAVAWVFVGEWRHRTRLYPTPQAPKPCGHGWRCWHCSVWLLAERLTGWRGWRRS